MLEKNIESIALTDLENLKINKVIEKKTLEYKLTIPSNKDSEKREFLADITSFANTSGGDIIFGVRENKKDNTIAEIEGIDIENVSDEKLRLEQIIQSGVSPRIPMSLIQPKIVELPNGRKVLIYRINASWTAPHRVAFQGYDKFYGRNSAGKYPLNVDELRIAFNLSETIKERIRAFRIDRVLKITAEETPALLESGQRIVVHIMPVVSFHSLQEYDIRLLDTTRPSLKRIYTNIGDTSGCSSRYNFEGFLVYSTNYVDRNSFYTQFYRNGIIESVETSLIRNEFKERKQIPVFYENYVLDFIKYHLSILERVNVLPPYVISLSLLGFKDYMMQPRTSVSYGPDHKILNDTLIMPECIIENISDNVERELKPTFDIVWNSCGKDKSDNYNETDDWAPKTKTEKYSE
jgi:hypothetical protein